MRITLYIALEVRETHAQIDKGWIDTTKQEVVHTIIQPSAYSNLVKQNESMKRFVKDGQPSHNRIRRKINRRLAPSQPEMDTTNTCDDINLAFDLEAVEEHSLRLAG